MKANLGTRYQNSKNPLVHVFFIIISSLLDHLFSSIFAIKNLFAFIALE